MNSSHEAHHKVVHVIGVLSNLNAQRNVHKELCDIELNMVDGTLHSHKAVLVTCSKYFEAMFSHDNMVENVEGRIDLSQFTCGVMDALLSYIYTGEIDISEDNLQSRLEASQYFQIDGVVERCCEFMLTSLSSNNYGDYLSETSRLSLKGIEVKIKTFIESNICLHFAKESEDQYQKLSFNYMYQLLNFDKLPKLKSEYELFQLCIVWAQREQTRPARHDECIRLLRDCVRYPLIRLQDLTDHVVPFVSDKNDSVLFNLVLDAQTYHLRPDRQCEYIGQRSTTMRFFTYGIVTLPQNGNRYLQLWQHPIEGGIEQSYPIKTANAPEFIPANASIAEMDGFIFVAGGEISDNGITMMQRYNPRNDTWFVCQPMQQGRCHFSLTPLNGKLYAVGGCIRTSVSPYPCTELVECYDVKRNKWEQGKSLTSSVYNHGATVIDRKLYIAGGERGAIQTYDPVSNKWECLVEERSLAKKRVHDMCCLGDILYILYGDGSGRIREKNIYRFSISSNKCFSLSSFINNDNTLIVSYVEQGKLRIVCKPYLSSAQVCSDDELLDIKVLSKVPYCLNNIVGLNARRVRLPLALTGSIFERIFSPARTGGGFGSGNFGHLTQV